MRLLLIVLLLSSFPVLAEPAAGFYSSVRIDSPLYDKAVDGVGKEHAFTVEGVKETLSANISVEACGVLTSTIETKIQPNIMDGGETAFVTLQIRNSATDASKMCQTQALAVVPPLNIDVPIEAGTSTLQIRHPNKQSSYEVTVTYRPNGA